MYNRQHQHPVCQIICIDICALLLPLICKVSSPCVSKFHRYCKNMSYTLLLPLILIGGPVYVLWRLNRTLFATIEHKSFSDQKQLRWYSLLKKDDGCENYHATFFLYVYITLTPSISTKYVHPASTSITKKTSTNRLYT